MILLAALIVVCTAGCMAIIYQMGRLDERAAHDRKDDE